MTPVQARIPFRNSKYHCQGHPLSTDTEKNYVWFCRSIISVVWIAEL